MHFRHSVVSQFAVGFVLILGTALLAVAAPRQTPANPLADGLRPFWRIVSSQEPFELSGALEIPIDGQSQTVKLSLIRYGKEAFDLTLTHDDYDFSLRRRSDVTAFGLPKHGVVFLGKGAVDDEDHLAPAGIAARLISSRTTVAAYMPLLLQADPQSVSLVLVGLLGMQRDATSSTWSLEKEAPGKGSLGAEIKLGFPKPGSLVLDANGASLQLKIGAVEAACPAADAWPNMRIEQLDRKVLERQLARGARRLLEIVAPSKQLTQPAQTNRRVPHGELRWVGGQRVVLLDGSPEQIGHAHGELLHGEAMACIDSVLNMFGTVQTIQSGKWFRSELQAAYRRLKPHIPERHLVETRALAQSIGESSATLEALNVFPEMFHCSGFALFGKATHDGKLYHGRVLDYMTEIGLQDAATTFIVKVDGLIPFANVGYAGFIGCVSGMNAQAVSLGEMGGHGEGQWDGVPMATLMRRALEECETLDEVMHLWKSSPRTCEYYYVFADGKTNRAVGVAAVPESVEFILPGQSHPQLGDGIEDAVLLSAGSRLEELRRRAKSHYGKFDAELAMWLMSRPVAMKSNLHNVLFVPEDGVLYVANADHDRPAAECPYVRLDLKALLAEMPGE